MSFHLAFREERKFVNYNIFLYKNTHYFIYHPTFIYKIERTFICISRTQLEKQDISRKIQKIAFFSLRKQNKLLPFA